MLNRQMGWLWLSVQLDHIILEHGLFLYHFRTTVLLRILCYDMAIFTTTHLTFQKFNSAKLKRSISVTAIDRLEFLGHFRMGGFHMVRNIIHCWANLKLFNIVQEMAKECLDVNAGMPNIEEVEDRGSQVPTTHSQEMTSEVRRGTCLMLG